MCSICHIKGSLSSENGVTLHSHLTLHADRVPMPAQVIAKDTEDVFVTQVIAYVWTHRPCIKM